MRFQSFNHMLQFYADTSPDAPALVYGARGDRVISFSALCEIVNARASLLREDSIGTYGILADGTASCVIEIFAAAAAKVRTVLLDENLPDEVLSELIGYTEADRLWGDPDLLYELSGALHAPAPPQDASVSVSADQPAEVLFFTSGTSERAKAVVLTEANLMASAYNGSALLPLSAEDLLLNILPLSHVFGFVCGLLWGLSCGCCVALGRGARYYTEDCALFKPTALSAVPLLWGFLLKQQALNPELSLVLIGAGGCAPELISAGKAMDIRMAFGYGLTETSSGVALSIGDDPYAMTVCPDDTVGIAPDGEILIMAPTCMMKGYFKQEEATAEVLKDGVLYTGDLGSVDADGKLHITGRKKEMLVLSDGTKVFLPEYEAECASVLGASDLCITERNGRLALIVSGISENEKEILTKLRPAMEKRPRGQHISFVEIRQTPLPRNASGKILRREIQ